MLLLLLLLLLVLLPCCLADISVVLWLLWCLSVRVYGEVLDISLSVCFLLIISLARGQKRGTIPISVMFFYALEQVGFSFDAFFLFGMREAN